jgi:hypothetical protein
MQYMTEIFYIFKFTTISFHTVLPQKEVSIDILRVINKDFLNELLKCSTYYIPVYDLFCCTFLLLTLYSFS